MDAIDLTRREILAGTAALCAASCLGGCEMENKKETTITTGVVNIGPASQFPAGTVSDAYHVHYGILVTNDSGAPLALRPRCTHAGCTVAWKEKEFEFVCPCHGSKFDLLGEPIHGPAKAPLPGVAAVKQPDGTLTVDLDVLYAA